MLWLILALQVINTALLAAVVVFTLGARQLGTWCQEVCVPWMVAIATLLRDAAPNEPPVPPVPPAPPVPGQ